MLYGHVPFHSSQHANLVKKVKHYMETKILPLPRDSLVSAYSIDLLQRLLDPEPAKRMSLNELISHPAIAGSPTERIMKSESDELTRTSKSCEKRFETKPCNPANDSRERSITPLRNPIPSKHVP
jgi:serine/threonine protein kinase